MLLIIALSVMVYKAKPGRRQTGQRGISVEVVDPRTISPLDEEGILESVAYRPRGQCRRVSCAFWLLLMMSPR